MDFLQIIIPLVEVLIIAVIFNYLLSFFWNTKSMDVIWGFLAFFALFAVSNWLQLPVLHKIMLLLSNAIIIAILIIFQPEIRMALSRLSLKGRRYKEIALPIPPID
jgi:diadenylate cyclase